jgi:hypothetical protein
MGRRRRSHCRRRVKGSDIPAVAAMDAARWMYSWEVEVVISGLEGMVIMFVAGEMDVFGDAVDEAGEEGERMVSVSSFPFIAPTFGIASIVDNAVFTSFE